MWKILAKKYVQIFMFLKLNEKKIPRGMWKDFFETESNAISYTCIV